jgi:ABC-type Na+ efflux pump permease subunit
MRDKFSALIGSGVGAVLMSTVFISNSVVMSVGIVVMSLLAGGGSYMLMHSMESPASPQKLSISIGNDSNLPDALHALESQLSKVNADSLNMRNTSKINKNNQDDVKVVDDFTDMLSSMRQLMNMPEFLSISMDDKNLMYSLVSSYITGAWDMIRNNIGYLSFSGSAHDKAKRNLQEISGQVDIINSTISRMQESIVNNQSSDVAVGTEYLKTRIHDDSSSLTIDDGSSVS